MRGTLMMWGAVLVLALSGCFADHEARPANWPEPIVAQDGECPDLSGTYIADDATEEDLFTLFEAVDAMNTGSARDPESPIVIKWTDAGHRELMVSRVSDRGDVRKSVVTRDFVCENGDLSLKITKLITLGIPLQSMLYHETHALRRARDGAITGKVEGWFAAHTLVVVPFGARYTHYHRWVQWNPDRSGERVIPPDNDRHQE